VTNKKQQTNKMQQHQQHKTIHFLLPNNDAAHTRKLMFEIYNNCIAPATVEHQALQAHQQGDEASMLFHFFYEPVLIIRVASDLLLQKIKAYVTTSPQLQGIELGVPCNNINDEAQAQPQEQEQTKGADAVENSSTLKFIVYSYPTPPSSSLMVPNVSKPVYCFGEKAEGLVLRHYSEFLQIFNCHSIVALKLGENQQQQQQHYLYSIVMKLLEQQRKYITALHEKFQQDPVMTLEMLSSFKLSSKLTRQEQDDKIEQYSKDIRNYCEQQQKQRDKQKDMIDALINRCSMVIETFAQQYAVQSKPINKLEMFSEYFLFMERVIHTMFNMAGYSRDEEALYLMALAKHIQSNSTIQSALTCLVQ